MHNQLGSEYPEHERRQYLSDNCDRVENTSYMKYFRPDDLVQMKDELSTVAIEINDIEVEKKEANQAYADALKPLKEKRKQILRGLKDKAENVDQACYVFFDAQERMAGFYNAEGRLVYSRAMRPQEMQGSIFNRDGGPFVRDPSTGKTGTNN